MALSLVETLDAHGEIAQAVFAGTGSMGKGSAMRVAPLGAYFADDLELVVAQARHRPTPTPRPPVRSSGALLRVRWASMASPRR